MAAEYTFHVSAWWTSGRTGLAKCDSAPNAIHFSEAAEFGGLEGRWTPEQLLLAALAGCFTTTFQTVSRAARFAYTDLEVEIEGTVRKEKEKQCFGFSEIVMRPTLTVSTPAELEEGLSLLRRAKAACLISRAIGIPQTLEPKVEVCKAPPEGWSEDAVAKLTV